MDISLERESEHVHTTDRDCRMTDPAEYPDRRRSRHSHRSKAASERGAEENKLEPASEGTRHEIVYG